MTETNQIANRSFGIELEVMAPGGMRLQELAYKVEAAGVPCHAEHYNHTTRRHWKIVTDGSLTGGNGMEVVSPKLTGEDGVRQARIVAKALEDAGCKVNVSCGFHLHVDATDFTPDVMKKVAIQFFWYETFFDHIVPASRRGSHNAYIKSNRSRFGGYGTAAVNEGIRKVKEVRSDFDAIIDVVNGVRYGDFDRYFKLNLTAFRRHRTIEFRQHSGTVDADKIEHWIRLMVGFVSKAVVAQCPRLRRLERDHTAEEEMRLFLSYFPAPKETKRFYMKRRLELLRADHHGTSRRRPAA